MGFGFLGGVHNLVLFQGLELRDFEFGQGQNLQMVPRLWSASRVCVCVDKKGENVETGGQVEHVEKVLNSLKQEWETAKEVADAKQSAKRVQLVLRSVLT